MIKKISKILLISFIFSIVMIGNIFAENLNVNMTYGINNIAKNGNQLPIEIRVQNKDSRDFKGYVLIDVFESNRSVYVYRTDIAIKAKNENFINKNISITSRANTIVIEVYNEKEELITSERTNIDLSYLDDSMIVGAITSDMESLRYIDGLSFYNNILRIRLVEINESIYSHNKNLFDQLDAIIISDVDFTKFTDGFSYALQNYMNNGKPVIVGLGGKNGIYTIPQYMYKYLSGPTVESRFNDKNITNFNFINSKVAYSIENTIDIKYTKDDNCLLICSPISFNDLNGIKDNEKIVATMIETAFGNDRLDRIISSSNEYMVSDYYNISNLLNIIDKLKLPDIFIITIMLVFYIAILSIIIYVFLRNINKRNIYGRCAIVFSIIFTIIMFYLGYGVMKKNTFLTYLSVVDIRNESTNEKAFLNFRTSESGSYHFDTSANNKIYPIIKNTNEAILSTNFIDMKSIKKINFVTKDNRINIDVDNASDFDSNLFVYENNNYLNDIYNIDCSVKRFNGEISGRITNNMDIKINDANVLMFGKVLKIGDIEPNHSVSLSRAENLGVPIGNNSMLSEILTSGNNQNFLRYYLDENIYQYYNYALLFGFIDDNGTIDINSTDVGDVYGKTLIVRRIKLDEDEKVDICSLNEEVNNISGYYDKSNNSINGDTEVINEYTFDNNYKINSIYFENITSYDQGKLDYNVPFYGEVTVYNQNTKNYDVIEDGKITYQNVDKYISSENKMIIRFVPSSMDPLYRKICLPIARAVASK